jgi:hypothetical protein
MSCRRLPLSRSQVNILEDPKLTDLKTLNYFPFSSQNRSQEMIPMSAVCDGKRNCSNGMDERKCASISDEFPVVTDKYG